MNGYGRKTEQHEYDGRHDGRAAVMEKVAVTEKAVVVAFSILG